MELDIIKTRFLSAVNEYAAVFKEGISYAILSRKYGKKLTRHNGLDVFLEDMRKEGKIHIYMKKNGAKMVTPIDESGLTISSDYQKIL